MNRAAPGRDEVDDAAPPTRPGRPVRVLFCWTRISGYMAACWRALGQRDDVDVHVLAFAPEVDAPSPFTPDIMAEVPAHLLDADAREDSHAIAATVREHAPDVLVVPGWAHRPYRKVIAQARHGAACVVLAMDTPWRDDWRQRAARWRLRRFLRRIDRVVVPGERGWQYARRLGFDDGQIHRGLYGVDVHALEPAYASRTRRADGWPRRFVFLGRYAQVKGLDVLLEAYGRYRERHDSPFELTCCGTGPLAGRVRAAAGVTDRGFVQPGDLPTVLAEHGALVLPSRYDPWPLALVEGCAAGLPVVCTSACGSAVEVVRDEANGWIVPPDDVEALAAALGRAHAQHETLPTMGRCSQSLAAPFGSELWATHWARMLDEPRAPGASPGGAGAKTPAAPGR